MRALGRVRGSCRKPVAKVLTGDARMSTVVGMTNTRTIKARVLDSNPSTFFGTFDVPETASNYRVLVHRGGGSVSIALLNWERSAEYGHLPTNPNDSYSLAEHLTNENMVDAENLIGVFRYIAEHWQAMGAA